MKVLTQFLLITSLLFTLSTNETPRLDPDDLITPQASLPEVSKLVKKLIEAKDLTLIRSIITENPHLVSTELIEAILQAREIDPAINGAQKTEAINRALLGLSQRVNHRKGMLIAINHLGIIYTEQKRYDLAIEYHKHCLPILRQIGDKFWLGKTHRLIGRIYYIQKNYFAAREHFVVNFKLAQEIGNPYYLALANNMLGTAFEESQLFNEAIRYYKESLAISRAITQPPPDANLPRLIGDTLIRYGRTYVGSGQFHQSLIVYRQTVDHWRQIAESPEQISVLAAALNSLGYASFEARLYQQAIEASTESHAIAEKLKRDDLLALSSRVIALAHSSMRNHTEAIKAINEAKRFAEKSEQTEIQRIIYRVEGIVYYAAKQPEFARQAFDKAIKLVEQQQSRVPFSIETGPSSMGYPSSSYGWMVALMVSQKQTEEALKYSEMVKSRALLNLLNNPKHKETGLIPKQYLEEHQQLTRQILKLEIEISKKQFAALPDSTGIAKLQPQLDEASQSLAKLAKKVDQVLLDTSENGLKSTNLTKQDLKSLLPNDQTAMLQFAISEEQAFLFVATKSSGEVDLQAYPLILKNNEIASAVKNFRNLITNRDRTNELGLAARDLHDKLLGAAQAQLKNKNELIIVPDGPLWELPFQALKTADNHYLIERCAISYAPSFSVLQMASKRQPSRPAQLDLLAFGNPFLAKREGLTTPNGFTIDPLDNLQDAETLVKKISRLHNTATSNVLIGKLATEEKFKLLAPKYRIIILAAHGLFGDLDPMRSSIVLAQTGRKTRDDGFLEAREIATMKLSAEMAVLSACDTGRGQIRDGEGIVGLPWAIFVAGCPTTVVSQWKVDSVGTADLMTLMYSHLYRNNRQATKAEALQKAAISMLNSTNKDFHHPFYWAGFILFGKAN